MLTLDNSGNCSSILLADLPVSTVILLRFQTESANSLAGGRFVETLIAQQRLADRALSGKTLALVDRADDIDRRGKASQQ